MSASLTDTVHLRDEAVERADSSSTQLAASIRCEDAYMSELTVVKENLAETRVERTNLRRSASDLVAKVQEASASLGGTLQAAVKSLNCLSEDVADKVKAEMELTRKWMLSSLDMEYTGALRRIRASVVLDDDELLRNVARFTALISV